jgi:hypothetical protein
MTEALTAGAGGTGGMGGNADEAAPGTAVGINGTGGPPTAMGGGIGMGASAAIATAAGSAQ